MPFRLDRREQVAFVASLGKWLVLAAPLGAAVGSAVALFLSVLDVATDLRFEYPLLLWSLPVAGAGIGWLYATCGKSVEAGNNLIVDEIHEPGGGVPLRMAPLVLIATVVTHLCGGSAGREGTAVQMGGSLAGGLARLIPGLNRNDTSTLLMAGVAAGFGGVFGTPVAGAIFALEVLAIGRIASAAILPCLIAAIASDRACAAWGILHTPYRLAPLLPIDAAAGPGPFGWHLLAAAALGGVVFGLASVLFAELTHGLHGLFERYIRWPIVRPVVGGCMVIALVATLGTREYLGLGVTSPDPGDVTIVSAFRQGGADVWSWWWKIVFTAVTLGSGFKGGEVTPLFFVGASLGNTLAVLIGAPVGFMAALGFVSVFAGATNTPIACTVMAVELFGGEHVLFYAVSCVLAYLCSGHSGIYLSQRIEAFKSGAVTTGGEPMPAKPSLRSVRAYKPPA
jgi:H+/Cl- antiporter ClcA